MPRMRPRLGSGSAPTAHGPALSRFGHDLTGPAGASVPLVGREVELAETLEVLLRSRRNNVLVEGPGGAGKSAFVSGVQQHLLSPGAPAPLAGRMLYGVDVRTMVAGAIVRGQLEERLGALLGELRQYGGRLIPVFEDLDVLAAGPLAGQDISWYLHAILDQPDIPVIATGEAAPPNGSPAYGRLGSAFQRITLRELSPRDLDRVLEAHVTRLEGHHGAGIGPEALAHAARLARTYVRHRALPDSALLLLDQAAANARLDPGGAETVTPLHVARVACRWTGIPVDQLVDEDTGGFARLEEFLERRVVGQPAAVRAVANAARRARARINDPARPLGSFLFLGPTGVGKTELARALAALLFQDEEALIRLDMSEFMERHQIARLIGAPPGYVGYGEGGQLTQAVRERPYSVVLLDELEKAHADVFNLLLQVMEDGRLTDGQGRLVDFSHTVVILTSNCGSDHIVRLTDAAGERVTELVMDAVRAQFKPEFLNRIDEIIVFNRLTRDVLRRIVDIQVARLQDRLAEHGITVALSPAARDWLGDHGYNVEYGARPLRRLIRRQVEDALALHLVAGHLHGGDSIAVDVDGTAVDGTDLALRVNAHPSG